MARGSTSDYSVLSGITGTLVIQTALENLGVISVGGTPSTAQYAFALKQLNLLCKNVMGPENRLYRGLKMWQRASGTLTLTAVNHFHIYSGSTDLDLITPVDIISASLKNTDEEETALEKITRAEFDALGDKSASGDPTKFYYEREYGQGTLYLDYVVSDLTDVIVFTYYRALYDLDAHTEDVDFPQQWFLPLVYLLTVNLAAAYGKDPSPYIPLLEEARENANTFYPERTTVYFQPLKDY